MGCDDGGVFHTGIPLAAGIGEDVFAVERDDKNRRRTVAAGRDRVDLLESLRRLQHVDALLLQVFGRRGQTPGIQYGGQLFRLHLPVGVLFA